MSAASGPSNDHSAVGGRFKYGEGDSIGQLQPHLPDHTESRPIFEVKLVRALSVLCFVRSWESKGAVVFG